MFSKKAMSPVVATALLLVVGIIAVVNFQGWYQSFQSTKLVDVDEQANSGLSTKIEGVVGSNLFVNNGADSNITISSVIIDGITCSTAITNISSGVSNLDISGCVSDTTKKAHTISLVSDNGVFTEKLIFAGAGATGPFYTRFDIGSSCSGGYTKLFGLYSTSNSMIEIASENTYTYSSCTSHDTYTLGTSCSGNYETLFYLGDINSSHIWIDNSSAYTPSGYNYNWQEVCLSSNSGTITVTYNSSDMSSLNYFCVGSYIQDDTYGGHMGNCAAYSDRIWARIN